MEDTSKNEVEARNDTVSMMVEAEKLGLNLAKPFSRRILVLETYLAGVFHVQGIKSRMKKLKEHDTVRLLRDVQNEYDPLAILVQNEKGQKLGFIPRTKNEVLARLMDVGKCFEAEVVFVKDNTKEDTNVFTSLQIRIRVYLVE